MPIVPKMLSISSLPFKELNVHTKVGEKGKLCNILVMVFVWRKGTREDQLSNHFTKELEQEKPYNLQIHEDIDHFKGRGLL